MHAIESLSEQFQLIGLEILIIKGCTTHILTGDSTHLRFSADIDMLSSDLARLRQVLGETGFQSSMEDFWDNPDIYKVFSGDVVIEAHDHFPVYSYPECFDIWGTEYPNGSELSYRVEDFQPDLHGGQWVQPFADVGYRELNYSDIRTSALPFVSPYSGRELKNVFVPSPSMAVLISCQNIFKDFVTAAVYCNTWLRMSDLLEIKALIQNLAFDRTEFARYIDQFGCYDAIELANRLLLLFEDSPTLQVPSTRKCKLVYGEHNHLSAPQLLSYWGNNWAALRISMQDAIAPYDAATIISKLQPNAIEAPLDRPSNLYCIRSELIPSQLSRIEILRYILSTNSAQGISLGFSLSWSEYYLSMSLILPVSTDPNCDAVAALFLGVPDSVHLWMNANPVERDEYARLYTSVRSGNQWNEFTASYPWSILPKPAFTAEIIYGALQVITVDRRTGNPQQSAPTILVPIEIIKRDKVSER